MLTHFKLYPLLKNTYFDPFSYKTYKKTKNIKGLVGLRGHPNLSVSYDLMSDLQGLKEV